MNMRILLCVALFILHSSSFTIEVCAEKKQKRSRYEYSYEIPTYVEELKAELTYPYAWGNSNITDFDEWRKAAREKVFECMLSAPKATENYDVEVICEEQREGYKAKKLLFNISAYARVTAYLLIPDGDGPFPAVNALHDHGGQLFIGKEKMIRPIDEDTAVISVADRWVEGLYEGQYLGDYLAENGYVVLSVDAPLWGDRGREEGVSREKYDIIAGNMQMLGRCLSAWMTYDDITSTEFLSTLPCVDSSRIACVGLSMGSYRSWMLAALSDKIRAGASICWMVTTDVQLTKKYGRKENGGFANCIPGLRQYMDYPHIASMACPKPMLFINGSQDKLFPVDGVNDAFAIMRDVWKSQGAEEHLVTEIWDIPHSCPLKAQEKILEFLNEEMKVAR